MSGGKNLMYNSNSVLSTIRMTRQMKPNITFMLVEGESDVNFYNDIVDTHDTIVLPLKGKKLVIDAIKQVNKNKNKFAGVVAVVDSDYDKILEKTVNEENLLYTDTHDIETLYLRGNALEKILAGYGDQEKIHRLEKQKNKTIQEIMLDIGEEIGKLRLISEKMRLDLSFKDIPLEQFINHNYEFNILDFIDRVVKVSKTSCNSFELKRMYDELKENYDVWQLCRGHDLTAILLILLRDHSNNVGIESKAYRLNEEKIEELLFYSYQTSLYFVDTSLYSSLIYWAETHPYWKTIKQTLQLNSR